MLIRHRLTTWAHSPYLTCLGPSSKPWNRGHALQLSGQTLLAAVPLIGRGWDGIASYTEGDPLTAGAIQLLLTSREAPPGTIRLRSAAMSSCSLLGQRRSLERFGRRLRVQSEP